MGKLTVLLTAAIMGSGLLSSHTFAQSSSCDGEASNYVRNRGSYRSGYATCSTQAWGNTLLGRVWNTNPISEGFGEAHARRAPSDGSCGGHADLVLLTDGFTYAGEYVPQVSMQDTNSCDEELVIFAPEDGYIYQSYCQLQNACAEQ